MAKCEDIDTVRKKLVAILDARLVLLLERFIELHVDLHEENCEAFATEAE